MSAPTIPAPRQVVFFHAHPDDEAIFTGGTIALLAAAGCSITVIVATSGQLGCPSPRRCDDIGQLREAETLTACALLGVKRVEFLRYRDSGMPGHPANTHPDAFGHADIDRAAARVAGIAAEQHATDLVIYDPGGIYGHPDHIQVHRVGTRAARLAAVPTVYQSTVDRDYLHATHRTDHSHLVNRAHQGVPAHLALGVAPGRISATLDSRDHLDTKRAAIAAHRSQVPATSDVVTMSASSFAHLYAYEWYIRRGPPSVLEHLAARPARQHLPAA